MQNMENQNRFDLEHALHRWREDCASRSGISFDNARELESDLRERVADLLKQGLNENEAFGRAVRQVGSPSELAREFARENPLELWRERLFWVVAAGFAISIWSLLSAGTISWFVNTFGVLLPFAGPAWFSLASNVPLLAMAVLLASGKLERMAERMRYFSRQHLAYTGSCLIAAGLLVRLFGPCPLRGHVSLIGLAMGPLLLLFVSIGLFRPARAAECATSAAPLQLPVVVWRERVFWMAVGALAVGVWQTVSWAGMKALFYTGDINRPFLFGPLFLGSWWLIELSPIVVLGVLLRQRMRAGKDITAGRLVRSRGLFGIIPVVVCAWAALHLWSEYYWLPERLNISFSTVLANYFTTFRWLWPTGVALLILWLAPGEPIQTEENLTTPVE